MGEQFGVNLLLYLYDESGAPIGLQYRSTSYAAGDFDTYYFEKNVFGDIVGLYTADGTKVGTYKYDAWGNCTRTAASGTTALQKQIFNTYNPFRYRGYYYDADTGLYYLQSRYYDPATGRFLNADGYIYTGSGLLGYNMYAYCNNNPVMSVDHTGQVPFSLWMAMPIIASCCAISILAEIAMPSQEEHYNRNMNNTCDIPRTEDEVPDDWLVSDNKEGTTRSKGPAANAHQFTASDHKSNVKYVSPDGKMEAIYDVNGNLVTAPEDIGTYNFCPSNSTIGGVIGHYVMDVRPWIRWGNSPEDTTTQWERMRGLLGIYE